MMDSRKTAFDNMDSNIGVPVTLVNDSSLATLTRIPEDAEDIMQIHPAFQ